MTNKQIILHLGVHKTGSSSIQATLSDPANAQRLANHGVYMPQSLPSNCSRFFISAFSENPENYHANRRDCLSASQIRQQTKTEARKFREEVGRSSLGTVILSGEDGCMLAASGFRRLHDFLTSSGFRHRDIKVLVYTRDPLSYVNSAIQENVKGNGLTIAQSKQNHIRMLTGKYQQLVQQLKTVFDENNIAVRSFENAVQDKGDVVSDFLSQLGISADGMILKRENTSIADDAVRLLSSISEKGIPITPGDKIMIQGLPGEKGNLLSESDRNEIFQNTLEDMDFLHNHYGIDYQHSMEHTNNSSDTSTSSSLFASHLEDIIPKLSAPVAEHIRAFQKAMQKEQ